MKKERPQFTSHSNENVRKKMRDQEYSLFNVRKETRDKKHVLTSKRNENVKKEMRENDLLISLPTYLHTYLFSPLSYSNETLAASHNHASPAIYQSIKKKEMKRLNHRNLFKYSCLLTWQLKLAFKNTETPLQEDLKFVTGI